MAPAKGLAVTDSAVVKEGGLTKWTNFITGWALRYFVLTQTTLRYYTVRLGSTS